MPSNVTFKIPPKNFNISLPMPVPRRVSVAPTDHFTTYSAMPPLPPPPPSTSRENKKKQKKQTAGWTKKKTAAFDCPKSQHSSGENATLHNLIKSISNIYLAPLKTQHIHIYIYFFGICDHEVQLLCEVSTVINTSMAVLHWEFRANWKVSRQHRTVGGKYPRII